MDRASSYSSFEKLNLESASNHASSNLGAFKPHSRRALLKYALCTTVAAAPALLVTQNCLAADKQKRNPALLAQHSGLAGVDSRTKIVIELDGELQLKEPDPNKEEQLRKAAVKGKSTLDYYEKVVFADSELLASARKYNTAKGENWISGSASSIELRPECRETRMLEKDGSWLQYSEKASLTQREIELLASPVNSAVLEKLLPPEPAKPSSVWKIPAEDAKEIFNLDAVHSSTIDAKIKKVEKGVATIEFGGKLEATANSVPTTLEIKGNFQAKFTGSLVMVTWLGMVINEDREISQTEPGFQVTARVRLLRAEQETPLEISTKELRSLAEKDDPARWLVSLDSTAGRYKMLCDRRWKTYIDTGEEAILRCVENNTIIAQCNISRQPALDDGSQLTLEAFQAEVRKSLGDNFSEFLEANERKTSSNLRLMRAVAQGMAEEVPVQWIYNHLSDDSGRRIVMIYTMGGNVTDKFAASDEQMTSSFELLEDLKAASKNSPTLAPANGEEVKR